mmetsp:Transcript_112008/g.321898  ORF Transcript_112008/g.321898 Transcript_112008/m.321898 type:complete len:365 (+) Transcript_112008:76-1170(+)
MSQEERLSDGHGADRAAKLQRPPVVVRCIAIEIPTQPVLAAGSPPCAQHDVHEASVRNRSVDDNVSPQAELVRGPTLRRGNGSIQHAIGSAETQLGGIRLGRVRPDRFAVPRRRRVRRAIRDGPDDEVVVADGLAREGQTDKHNRAARSAALTIEHRLDLERFRADQSVHGWDTGNFEAHHGAVECLNRVGTVDNTCAPRRVADDFRDEPRPRQAIAQGKIPLANTATVSYGDALATPRRQAALTACLGRAPRADAAQLDITPPLPRAAVQLATQAAVTASEAVLVVAARTRRTRDFDRIFPQEIPARARQSVAERPRRLRSVRRHFATSQDVRLRPARRPCTTQIAGSWRLRRKPRRTSPRRA